MQAELYVGLLVFVGYILVDTQVISVFGCEFDVTFPAASPLGGLWQYSCPAPNVWRLNCSLGCSTGGLKGVFWGHSKAYRYAL